MHIRHVGSGSLGIEIQFSDKASHSLFTKWFHSFEEDKDDTVWVFRPHNFPFPAARFREGYEFFKNGDFVEYGLDPVDRPIQYKGKWIYHEKEKIIEITFRKIEIKKNDVPLPETKTERSGYFFEIYKLENGLMRLRKFY